jgi:hypothetical protein
VVWATIANPNNNASDPQSLVQNMFLAFQLQDGDWGYPSGSIAQADAVKMQIDWVAVDVPS